MAVDGVLLLDKPQGVTSNAALQRIKRLFWAKKAGHVGTLDPMASGLLPICLGEATKFSGYMLAADKSYTAQVQLGVTTNTGDAEGEITSRCAVDVNRESIESVLVQFKGEIMQTPPIYSALKKDGRPLYSYARAGEAVDIPPRAVTIRSIELLDFDSSTFRMLVRCSKGTYIRVLAEDIGRSLGCGGMLTGLRRNVVGGYDLSSAINFEGLEVLTGEQRLACLLPADGLVAALPVITLDQLAMRLITTGRRPKLANASGFYRMYSEDRQFLGIGELCDGQLLPKRLMSVLPPALEMGTSQMWGAKNA